MSTPSLRLLSVLTASFIVVAITIAPEANGTSMLGKTCTKVGAQTGDGPGRTVVCKKTGKKTIWQIMIMGGSLPKPGSTENTNLPTPTISPTSTISPTPTCTSLPVFTDDFIDPKYVRGVAAIGGQTGSGGVIAVRSYIFPSNEFEGQKLPIYAPVTMTLTQASLYKLTSASATYQPEYSLYFDVGCGISVKFFHIKGVVGNVAKVAPKVPVPSSAGQPVTPTKIAAGEQIGWYELGENSVAFDFWVDNQAHTNSFIVPSHFATSNYLHSVCPYDFYIPNKKAIWLAKLGGEDGNPVAGTDCGVVNQGLAGTADGMWFVSPDTKTDQLTWDGFYQSQIMLHTDPSGTIRIGGLNATQPIHQMFINTGDTTWSKTTDITVGASHCWSDAKQSVKVLLTTATTMSVVVGLGTCNALPDISTGKTYYR